MKSKVEMAADLMLLMLPNSHAAQTTWLMSEPLVQHPGGSDVPGGLIYCCWACTPSCCGLVHICTVYHGNTYLLAGLYLGVEWLMRLTRWAPARRQRNGKNALKPQIYPRI